MRNSENMLRSTALAFVLTLPCQLVSPTLPPYKLPNSQERKMHQRSSILAVNRMVHAFIVQQITALISRHEERTKATKYGFWHIVNLVTVDLRWIGIGKAQVVLK